MSSKRLDNPLFDNPMTYVMAGNVKEDDNPTNHDFEIHRKTDDAIVGKVHFQHGAIGEEGVNGILNEDILAMLIDRIESFQKSKLKCRENENALARLYEAMFWLNQRQNNKKKK